MPSPIGHILSGIIIGSVSTNDNKPKTKRLILGAFFAAAPDLDMLLVFVGVDYIYAHRTFSHSLLMVGIVAIWLKIMPLLIRLFSGKRIWIPWKLISVCLFSHILIDMLGQDECGPKGIMIFWPLSTDYYYINFTPFFSLLDEQCNPMPLNKIFMAVTWEIGLISSAGTLFLICYYFMKKRLKIDTISCDKEFNSNRTMHEK